MCIRDRAKIYSNITSVSPLTLGAVGAETLTEWNRVVQVPDNIRAISPINMTFRMGMDARSLEDQQFFEQWWAERDHASRAIIVDITDRSWKLLFTLVHTGCYMTSLSYDDLELGTMKAGYIQMSFNPYDVRLDRPSSGTGSPGFSDRVGAARSLLPF